VGEEGEEAFWAPEESDKSPTVTVQFEDPVSLNVVLLQEPISYGQRVKRFEVQALVEGIGAWCATALPLGPSD